MNYRGQRLPLQLTFEEYLGLPTTNLVFEGVVEDVMPARLVETGVVTFVYSPVVVRVTNLHRDETPVDRRFVLRAFGGVAEDVEFVSAFDARDEIKTVGRQLLVLADHPLRGAGDTL